MRPKRLALLGLLIAAAITGVLDTLFEGAVGTTKVVLDIAPTAVMAVLGFVWVYFDSIEIRYRRSPLFNVGLVALPVVFVPIYLALSRPKGRRFRAVLMFFGAVLLLQVGGVAVPDEPR